MPRIDNALDSLCGARYFSSLNLRSGYWQITMADEDTKRTTFMSPDGLFEFNVMPFGFETYESMMDAIFCGFRWKICLCYLNDIVVYFPTSSEHVHHLKIVFSCL